MFKHKRVLTIVEGRERNQNMAREVLRAAEKIGWRAQIVKAVSSIDIAENNLDYVFSDYVYWRGLDKNDIYEMRRMIEFVNKYDRVTLNTHSVGGLAVTSNKYFQHGIMMMEPELTEHILPMYEAKSLAGVKKLVELEKIKYPFCLKPQFGTRGEGIHLIESEDELGEIANTVNMSGMAVEPYIRSEFDWRVFVLDGRALGVMRKIGNTDDETDFEAKSGGRQRFNENDNAIREELCRLAVLAAKTSGLDYAGVDLIRDDKTGKFYVLETNFAGGRMAKWL